MPCSLLFLPRLLIHPLPFAYCISLLLILFTSTSLSSILSFTLPLANKRSLPMLYYYYDSVIQSKLVGSNLVPMGPKLWQPWVYRDIILRFIVVELSHPRQCVCWIQHTLTMHLIEQYASYFSLQLLIGILYVCIPCYSYLVGNSPKENALMLGLLYMSTVGLICLMSRWSLLFHYQIKIYSV